ncbi:glycoside hydrolase family 30 protein [Rhodanobacter lindaniclasticus]
MDEARGTPRWLAIASFVLISVLALLALRLARRPPAAFGTVVASVLQPGGPGIELWLSTQDRRLRLARQADVPISDAGSAPADVVIDSGKTYQSIVGFGAALTDASAWLLQNKLSAPARRALLLELFGPPPGLGFNMVRLTIGASDFSLQPYTLDDLPAGAVDPDLQHFNVAANLRDVIPAVQEVLSIDPDLRIIASPWSAPAWMKTSANLIGGTLLEQYESSYAQYLVKYVDTYRGYGIPIFALTLQNEPGFVPVTYPGHAAFRRTTRTDHRAIPRPGTGRAFAPPRASSAGTTTGTNRSSRWTCCTTLKPHATSTASPGTATAARPAHRARCTAPSRARTPTSRNAPAVGLGIRQAWRTALVRPRPAARRPAQLGARRDLLEPRAGRAVQPALRRLRQLQGHRHDRLAHRRGEPSNDEYYAFAHYSRFIRPGAVRIWSTDTGDDLKNVAFRNPDGGSIVLVLVNGKAEVHEVSVQQGDIAFRYTMPAESVATFVWRAAPDWQAFRDELAAQRQRIHPSRPLKKAAGLIPKRRARFLMCSTVRLRLPARISDTTLWRPISGN